MLCGWLDCDRLYTKCCAKEVMQFSQMTKRRRPVSSECQVATNHKQDLAQGSRIMILIRISFKSQKASTTFTM